MSKITVILTHSGADFDAVSSMYAAGKLYPDAFLIHPGSLDVSTQKLTHFFGDMLKLTKVRELPRQIRENVQRVIVVDTKIYNRIGNGREFINKKGVETIIFDHHPASPQDIKNAKIVYRNYGANTTILVELLRKKRIPLTQFEATFIALGIYEDTGSFMFPTTSYADFSAMQYLSSFGINMKIVSHFLSPSLSEEQMALFEKLLNHMEEYNIKGAKVTIATAKMDHYVPGIALIAHRIKEIIDTDFLFVIVPFSDSTFIVGRSSSPEYDLKKALSPFGGGHPTAASAVVQSKNIEGLKKKILENIKESYFPALSASQIMSFPVKTIQAKVGIKEALKIMVRFGFSGLPVKENGKVIGIISKRDIEKIMLVEHRDRPVKQYLLSNATKVPYNASLREIEESMVLNNVGRVLVEKDGEIIGIISRSDLVKAFYTKEYIKEIPYSLNASFLPKPSDITLIMKNQLGADIFKLIVKMGKIAERLDQKIYLVGGAVRDILLNKKSLDLDFVLSKDAIQFGRELQKEMGGSVLLHPEFQTSTYKQYGYSFDFTTARREYYNSSSLLPVVEPASIREDLGRRDFTINTLAIDITPQQFGTLYDFFGGFTDLRKGIIRVLHPLSFLEDPSRILRAIKYEVKFDFHLSNQTEKLLERTVSLNVFQLKKSKRILDELFELLATPNAPIAILKMEKRGILKELFGIKRLSGQRKRAILNAEKWINRFAVERTKVYFFLLVSKKREKEKQDILRYFSFPKNFIEKLVNTEKILQKLHRSIHSIDRVKLFFLLRNADRTFVVAYLSWASPEERTLLLDYLENLSYTKVELKGMDLKAMGLKEGPQYRKIFDEILKLRIQGKIHSKSDEVQYILDNRGKFEWK